MNSLQAFRTCTDLMAAPDMLTAHKVAGIGIKQVYMNSDPDEYFESEGTANFEGMCDTVRHMFYIDTMTEAEALSEIHFMASTERDKLSV